MQSNKWLKTILFNIRFRSLLETLGKAVIAVVGIVFINSLVWCSLVSFTMYGDEIYLFIVYTILDNIQVNMFKF